MHLIRHPAAVALLLLLASAAALRAGELVAGPMLGYRAHREVAVWLETRDAQTVELTYRLAGRPDTARTVTAERPPATPAGTQPQTFRLPRLEMGATYEYALTIDGADAGPRHPLTFRTADQWEWRAAPPDFSFLFGSCAYLNDPPYDRPGEPYGRGTEIFRFMASSGADFMVWGGDNVYLREADFSSRSGIWYRYAHDRATPDLQPLLAAMHHYATWDDHDYGPNNANHTFEFKDESLAVFQAYWANPSWGEPDNPGVYGKFYWGDAVFFMMDSRYHRDEATLDADGSGRRSVWGARQLEWLKQSLLHAKTLRHYAFKFIVTGGQVLQTTADSPPSETHELYRDEREELIDFIERHDLTGIVFLTGDVHHSALYRRRVGDRRFVYELTSSPLTSRSWNAAASAKGKDRALVPGTIVGTQNYCRAWIRGPRDAREILLRCFDAANVLQWEHVIPLEELR